MVMLEVFRDRTSVGVPLVRGLKRTSERFVSIPEGPEIKEIAPENRDFWQVYHLGCCY